MSVPTLFRDIFVFFKLPDPVQQIVLQSSPHIFLQVIDKSSFFKFPASAGNGQESTIFRLEAPLSRSAAATDEFRSRWHCVFSQQHQSSEG
jgi:hypothetical protein